MGCAACLGDKTVEVPLGYASALEMALFSVLKRDLKPCNLVPQAQFSEAIKQLQLSAFSSRRNNKITQTEHPEGQAPAPSEEQKMRLKWKLLVLCSGQDFYEPEEYDVVLSGLQHPCFSQIEKDLLRTFPGEKFFQSQDGILIFQRLLKRLALYFPTVGYTQGINFIVGYLLVLEFTQQEVFWMVVHMAISPRFLLLGFFEDGFPMSSMYCWFLNCAFRKRLPELFERFDEMGVAGEAWMFKWFMTYYLYSFPLEIAREVWSLVMLKGGVGMVYFALALLKELEKDLLGFDEATDVIAFMQNLKDLSTFNSLVDLKSLLKRAYSIEISSEQLEHEAREYIKDTKLDNFYSKFYAESAHKENQTKLLHSWQEKLRKERFQFRSAISRIVISEDGIVITNKVSQKSISQKDKPPRETRFRIKEEEFKKTKQKNFLEKSHLRESQMAASDLRKSKGSERNSKASRIIEISSISNRLQISQHTSSVRDHISRIPSEESFMIDDQSSVHREMTEQDISDGQLTARYNASLHVITKPANVQRPSNEEVEIFDLIRPFKKKKDSGSSRNQGTKISLKEHVIHLPESLCNLNKKTSQKTVIEIGHKNIVCVQETIYSIDPSEQSVLDFQASFGYPHAQSLGTGEVKSEIRYRTPQVPKSHDQSVNM